MGCYRLSADQGHATSQNNLGYCYQVTRSSWGMPHWSDDIVACRPPLCILIVNAAWHRCGEGWSGGGEVVQTQCRSRTCFQLEGPGPLLRGTRATFIGVCSPIMLSHVSPHLPGLIVVFVSAAWHRRGEGWSGGGEVVQTRCRSRTCSQSVQPRLLLRGTRISFTCVGL